MALTNKLKKQVDLPVWEWCRFAPTTSAAAMSTCSDESSGGQYIYYLDTTNLWRYDTISDGWQRLAGPQIPPLTISAMRYSVYGGYRGNVLSASATSVVLPGLQGNKLVGKTIRITQGTGAGQERVVSAITHEIVEHGSCSTASATVLTDNQTIPKKWTINQWAGYQCRIVYGTGESQVRNILYNGTATLTFQDNDWQPYDSWNNTPFSAIAPNAAPSTACNYYIEKSTATVPAWTTTPDATSKFVFITGGIWLFTGRTVANGSASMQYYDVMTDSWDIKTCPGMLQNIVCSLDASIERTGEIGGSFDSGDCDSSTARTMVDATKTWAVDRYANYQIRVTKTATGVVQRRRIIGNTANTLYINKPWTETPDTNFTWAIYGDTNTIWQIGNTRGGLLKYLIEEDLWVEAHETDTGVCNNMSITNGRSLMPIGYTATVNTAGILTMNAVPTNKGTGYRVGDICSINEATGGKIRVATISTGGVVETVELYASGTSGTYTAGAGKATTNVIPASGGGSSLTVNIATVGNVAKVTTAMAHNICRGDTVTTLGADVGAWNSSFTVIGCDAATTLDFAAPNGVAPTRAVINAAAGVLVDSTKAWTAGEFIGKLICKYACTGPIVTTEIRKITANTSTTITCAAWTLPVTGKDRYAITEMSAFGAENQFRVPSQSNSGWATSGNDTTLTETGKLWQVGQWVGYKVKVICGTGFDKGEVAITANTADTLTVATFGFTPDATTKYKIMDTWGIATGTFAATTLADSTKNWTVNQWAGKQLRIMGGSTVINTTALEVTITSNTATTLTFATITALTDATTTYCIISPTVRGSGIQLMWNYGRSDAEVAGKYLWCPRGGSSVTAGLMAMDKYDIAKDQWDLNLALNPWTEMEFLGSQWSYDGGDYIYWSQAGTASSRTYRINMATLVVDCAGQTPYAHGAAVQGNRMEIITTIDGLTYLYLMRSTGSEFWRTLLFW
jgi:hypothetical protein